MPVFDPQAEETIIIRNNSYTFVPQPGSTPQDGLAYTTLGTKSQVFKLVADETGIMYALKVYHAQFRTARYSRQIPDLVALSVLPGLEATDRICLDRREDGQLLQNFPDLRYAILMPWANDTTWADFIISRRPLTLDQSLKLAEDLTDILSGLENSSVAHASLSSANLIINPEEKRNWLVDLEDLYGLGFPSPKKKPAGEEGYRHRQFAKGGNQWNVYGDRFAGAILLGELLTWSNPTLRSKSFEGESFFDPAEMNDPDSERYQLIWLYLNSLNPQLGTYFEEAWLGTLLMDMPTFHEWKSAIGVALQNRGLPVTDAAPDSFVSLLADDSAKAAEAEKRKAREKEFIRKVRRNIIEVLVLAVLIWLIFIVLLANFKMDGDSMNPTLKNGQYVFVSKISYYHPNEDQLLYRFSPNPSITMHNSPLQSTYLFSTPAIGDLIAYHDPFDNRKTYVKRIVAVPGQRIKLVTGSGAEKDKIQLFKGQDNQPLNLGNLLEYPHVTLTDRRIPPICGLSDPTKLNQDEKAQMTNTENTPDNGTVVPAGCVAVMGDKPQNSKDSRDWGFLDENMIIGKVFMIYWPLSAIDFP